MAKHTATPWVNGWGNGLTGPNTPNMSGVTVSESLRRQEYGDGRLSYDEWCEHIPISLGDDTLAVVVGPNREANAAFIVQAVNCHDELVERLRAYVELEEQAAPYSSSPMREKARAILAKVEKGGA